MRNIQEITKIEILSAFSMRFDNCISHKTKNEFWIKDSNLHDITIEFDFETADSCLIRYYHRNGSLWKLIPYKFGIKNGTERVYNNNLKLVLEIIYCNGIKWGVSKYYYEDGKIRAEITFVDNKLHGEIRHYDKDKNVICLAVYENNKKLFEKKC